VSWGVIAGVIGLLLAAAAVVWYKIKSQSNDASLAQNAADQANAAHDVAEKQLAAKNDEDRKALNDQIAQIHEIKDVDVRQRAALELLRRVRGVQ
jgi:type II secretory pathway pseudopilin PulG